MDDVSTRDRIRVGVPPLRRRALRLLLGGAAGQAAVVVAPGAIDATENRGTDATAARALLT